RQPTRFQAIRAHPAIGEHKGVTMSRRHHHISTAIALALALAAVAPSAASARPQRDPPATTTQTQAPPAIAANAAVGAIQAQGARVARELAARDAGAG